LIITDNQAFFTTSLPTFPILTLIPTGDMK